MSVLTREELEQFRTQLRNRQNELRSEIDEELVREERENYQWVF
jgi:hypothetical protein